MSLPFTAEEEGQCYIKLRTGLRMGSYIPFKIRYSKGFS